MNGQNLLGTVDEIAARVGGQVVGDGNRPIFGVAAIEEATDGDLTFLANQKYRSFLETTNAAAVLVDRDTVSEGKNLIQVDQPYLAFAQALTLLAEQWTKPKAGVHPTAVLGKDVELGEEVSVMAYAVLDDQAKVGDRTVVYPQVYIGKQAVIGCDCTIYPHVSIRERVTVGDRVIVHSGTVIGSDGFGFAQDQGINVKIPQVGTVLVGDDVEIGSNVSIDRGTMGRTVIGKGTKLDNLIQVGHNVRVGEDCVIVAQSGISGSTKVGKGVMIGGQVGIVGHITLGDGARVAARSGISKNVKPGSVVMGAPARPMKQEQLVQAYTRRLPDLFKEVDELKARIEALEGS